jgi:peroxiredoxin
MTIEIGGRVPAATLHRLTASGLEAVTTEALFAGKKIVVFGLPGAFTRTCSARHLPGYVTNAAEILEKGVDAIACVSVNDAFVMNAWGKAHGADGKVMMLGDGSGELTRALGLELDRRKEGMGMRSQRYAMVVEDGVVTALAVEPAGQYGVSSAEAILAAL